MVNAKIVSISVNDFLIFIILEIYTVLNNIIYNNIIIQSVR
jgi:hypothetical protein